ncbi:hypothetical protein EDB85DRAFT_2156929 [Lactarius pseudohatsudake]|nr:hypothetical protein EDB85DRAFT_2156929 [Lactarius pseudohatsudake]
MVQCGRTNALIYLDTSTSLVRARDVWAGFLVRFHLSRIPIAFPSTKSLIVPTYKSVYTPCQNDIGQDPGKYFLEPTSSVRYVLIDISHQLVHKYSDTFELALTPRDVISAVKRGKISALLGNSLDALRQFAARGVRYVTLTRTYHNVVKPLHHGLRCAFLPIAASQLNRRTIRAAHSARLMRELNRLGVLVGLSHTSDDIALAALKISRGTLLWHVGTGAEQLDGVVMVCSEPSSGFVSEGPDRADVKAVADHVGHITSVTGRAQYVSVSSHRTFPFARLLSSNNMYLYADISTYPVLVRSTPLSLRALTPKLWGNFLPVFAGAEDVVREGVAPAQDLYEKRTDIPKKH